MSFFRSLRALLAYITPALSLAYSGNPYPTTSQVDCPTSLTREERFSLSLEAIAKTLKALEQSPFSPHSLWDQTVFEKDPALKKALEEYLKEKRASSLKALKLEGLSAKEIHDVLLKAGFSHTRLTLSKPEEKSLPAGAQAKPIVMTPARAMDIYTHADGALVRVKPQGVDDSKRRQPNRLPQYTLGVLYDAEAKCDEVGKNCKPDTSFDNEAFKVTALGQPVPKTPKPAHGFLYAYGPDQKRERRIQADTAMSLVHFMLPTACLKKPVRSAHEPASRHP
jgi:hypothetical protein